MLPGANKIPGATQQQVFLRNLKAVVCLRHGQHALVFLAALHAVKQETIRLFRAPADPAAITDPKTQEFTKAFADINAQDGLAFYPDWPVAGYYDQIVSAMQSLANQSKSPAEVLSQLETPYVEGKADLIEG